MPFKDKVILITGAASGIGAATALKFSSLNAQMALVDKDDNKLKEILTRCERKSGRKHLAIIADLSKVKDVLTVVPTIIEHYRRIEVLINCAGILMQENIIDIKDIPERFDKIMDINLKAPVILTNKAAPYLIESKGNIINISSVKSSGPGKKLSLYATSKAALEVFTKCVALDLADRGVRANSVHPGLVRTNIFKNYKALMDVEELYKVQAESLPFGVIEPEEVAKLIVFLANNEHARSITGASYYIDGGMSTWTIGA